MSEVAQPTRVEALKRVAAIPGWLTSSEAGALYDLGRAARGPIVEIGSWQGRSTAALALGSMAGEGHPVYAIEPFLPVPQKSGEPHAAATPASLRANLDAAGVNGLVTIVPTTSEKARECIPQCDVLFVDGDHSHAAAYRDLTGYLPKVLDGGRVMIHDVDGGEPGVEQAVDEVLVPATNLWTVEQRIGGSLIARRRVYPRRQIMLGAPGRGYDWAPIQSLLAASKGHEVGCTNNGNGWDDFNALWARAINAFERGECTHFAMMHSDVAPEANWLDILMMELEDRQADLVSVIIPIKDPRGLTSSGIMDPDDRWGPYRRFTMREVQNLPQTFSAEDARHLGAAPELGRHLLHNTGCWVCDLRNPLFREVDAEGALRCWFDFPTRVVRHATAGWVHLRESEDWFFSRKIAELGARTYLTRRVALSHIGGYGFGNQNPWGDYESDKDTQHKWGRNESEALAEPAHDVEAEREAGEAVLAQ